MELSLYKTRLALQLLDSNREWPNILDRMMLNLYNKDGTAFAKAKSECAEKHIIPGTTERAELILKARKVDPKNLLPDKTCKELYVFLKQRYPQVKPVELTKCVLRYAALGMGGQQWASNHEFMNTVRRTGIAIEAFASPFNHYFKKYYSVFKSDSAFGSLGGFFDTSDAKFAAGVYANPPFTPFVLEKMAEKVCKYKKAVLVTPTWTDAPWYQKLLANGFTATLKKNASYTALGEEFTPHFTTTVWTKGVLLG